MGPIYQAPSGMFIQLILKSQLPKSIAREEVLDALSSTLARQQKSYLGFQLLAAKTLSEKNISASPEDLKEIADLILKISDAVPVGK